MIKRFLYGVLFVFLGSFCFSQSTSQAIANGQDPNVLYRNEMSFGIFAHSRGFGLNFMRAKHVTGTRKRLLEIEALNMKHPKEIKVSNNIGKFFNLDKDLILQQIYALRDIGLVEYVQTANLQHIVYTYQDSNLKLLERYYDLY